MNKVRIFSDGGCMAPNGVGGWASLLEYADRDTCTGLYGAVVGATNNTMELTGVIKGLEFLDTPHEVELISDSEYVVKGIKEWLPNWKLRGWRRSSGGQVANLQLWQKIDSLIGFHKVTPLWVPGHSGNPGNEWCDSMCLRAMGTPEIALNRIDGRFSELTSG